MSTILESAISSVQKSDVAFCKFISANDAGKTGGHQSGFYIPKNSIKLMFNEPGVKGENKERLITIKWQDDFVTNSRFIYYGQYSRNEYRLTRFGRGFPFLTDDNVGDLFILCHIQDDYYEAFILQSDDAIEDFFSIFNMSPVETNNLIDKSNIITAEEKLMNCFQNFIDSVNDDFPSSIVLANTSRNCYFKAHNISDQDIRLDPDSNILEWINAEFQLFKFFENDRYRERISTCFNSVEELISFANSILNRRKSRAGRSLEHHLAKIFDKFALKYDAQVITEDHKKPDFIFPNSATYHNKSVNPEKLTFLASKTTCKDRWRQILNEADRIKDKHLFTLQQGISINQLKEMYKYNVKLVVPEPYLRNFPADFRSNILTLNSFVSLVQAKQS